MSWLIQRRSGRPWFGEMEDKQIERSTRRLCCFWIRHMYQRVRNSRGVAGLYTWDFDAPSATFAVYIPRRSQDCLSCVSKWFEYMQHVMHVRSIFLRFDAFRTSGRSILTCESWWEAATVAELGKVC